MTGEIENIYLADDDQDDVYFFKHALKTACPGCRLTIAADGGELLNKLMNAYAPPDLVFVDINMPVLNGLEALKKIRETAGLQAMPVIMYSTSKSEADVMKAFTFGASAYIVKPGDPDCLEELITKALSLDWARQLIERQFGRFVLKL